MAAKCNSESCKQVKQATEIEVLLRSTAIVPTGVDIISVTQGISSMLTAIAKLNSIDYCNSVH